MTREVVKLNGWEIVHRDAFCATNSCPACEILRLRREVQTLGHDLDMAMEAIRKYERGEK